MKQKKIMLVKRAVRMLFMLSFMMLLVPSGRAQAQSVKRVQCGDTIGVRKEGRKVRAGKKKVSNKVAAQAYKKFLTSSEAVSGSVGTTDVKSLKFAVLDINHDGCKELYITGDDAYHGAVYAYLNGKVTQIDDDFSGGYVYYTNTNLVYKWTDHGGSYPESYSRYVNDSMQVLANADGTDYVNNDGKVDIKYTYYINGKKTTKKKYQAYVEKLTKGKKKRQLKLHRNTSVNRNLYIR